MKASEAKILSLKNKTNLIKSILDEIYCEIKKCASHGNFVYNWYFESNREGVFVNDIVENLRDNGYLVNHVSGSDYREEESFNYLTISW
jgi:hypothetical protein